MTLIEFPRQMAEVIFPDSTLVRVPHDELDRTWPLVMKMIDRAYAASGHDTPSDLLGWLKRGEGLLWLAITSELILAAMTTSIVPRRNGTKAFRIWSLAGQRIELWKSHIPAIEGYARSLGCDKICFDGRLGWQRILPGYHPITSAYEKELAP